MLYVYQYGVICSVNYPVSVAIWGGKFQAYHHQTRARKNMRGHRRSIYKSWSKTVKNGPKHL